jgi:hypothetical protein
MSDRTVRNSDRPPGPWPEVHGNDRIFDHGAGWCTNAVGHPGFDVDYPDPIRHLPPYECRSSGLFVDAADGLTGRACDVEVYAARPYQFGELRSAAGHASPRIVFDVAGAGSDNTGRFSVSFGDALRIAVHVLSVVRRIDGWVGGSAG